MTSNCTFPTIFKDLLDLSFSDYNPFCNDNRDPAATGNDQCYGIKELKNPYHASTATGQMSGVLQVLFLPIMILLFLVKE